jgi:hypothetical protein
VQALLAALLLLAAAPQPAEELAISFEAAGGELQAVGLDAAVIQLGTLRGAGAPSANRRTSVRLRIASRNPATRFARLTAYLQVDDPHCRVRVDGILLSSVPQVIDARAPVGRPLAHTLQIEVPAAAPAGALQSSITWVATTD